MTRQFKKLAHSRYECKYHIVFCPKYRYRIFKDEVASSTQPELQELCRRKADVEVLEVSIQPDHIHRVLSIAPKYALSEFRGYLKGKLALRLFRQYEHLGKRFWRRHRWATGSCVSSIGLDEERIRKYIKWQEDQEKQAELVQRRLFE